jgi:hypothetical protein
MKHTSFSRPALVLVTAIAGLLSTPHQASAGIAELKAIATQLNGGLPPAGATTEALLRAFINTKTSAEQSAAVIALMKAKTSAAAAYSGEILKSSNKSDFGTVFGQALNADQANLGFIFGTTLDPVKNAATKAKYIGTAAKTAATGKGAFSEWIDEFAHQLATTNAEAYDAAKSAAASKTAVGLIVASQTLNGRNNSDALRLDLVRRALLAKNAVLGGTGTPGQGLTASAQEIMRYVGDAVSEATIPQFTRDLVSTSVTIGTKTQQPLLKSLPSIVTGAATSNSATAASIVNSVFDYSTNQTIPAATINPVFATAVKNASKLAATVSLVADAEQVQALSVTLGTRVGLTNTDLGKTKVVGIPQTTVAAIVKGLVLGLTNRPTTASNISGDTRANRIDEIGEVGAYMLNAIKNLPDFQGKDIFGNPLIGSKLIAAQKKSASLVTTLIKTIISSSSKVHVSAAQGEFIKPDSKGLNKAPVFQAAVADDAAGSIAQTIRSIGAGGFGPGVFDAIKTALTNPKIGTTLGGKANAATVNAALNTGFNTPAVANLIYEDGTIAANAIEGTLNQPETDKRNR